MPAPVRPGAPRASAHGFWRRRLIDPLVAFLAQGTSPAALSRTIAIAAVCGVFPFLGATTVLTLLVGLALRLNQPILQTLNQLLGPVQLLLIPVFVQGGAWLMGDEGAGFSVAAMLEAARDGSVAEFLAQFGRAGLYALVAWLVAAPAIFAAVWLGVRPFINRLATARGAQR